MNITLSQLAAFVQATVVGDANAEVSHFAPIDKGDDGALSFLSNPKYESYIYSTQATCVIVSKTFKATHKINTNLLLVDDVYATLSILLDKFSPPKEAKVGIEQPVYITEDAKYGEGLYLGAFSYIGKNVSIGKDVKIYPQVYIGDNCKVDDGTIIYAGSKIYADTTIGKYCILHAGCVIGSDGFGFAPMPDGAYKKIPQNGKVIIKDNVEIGANTTIDRATLESTIIHEGVKIDNLVQIAHNVEVGKNSAIASQAGISGSTKIGEKVVIAGQVGIVGHINIAKGTMIAAQSGIAKEIKEENSKWFGSPAMDYKDGLKAQIRLKQLDALFKRVTTIEHLLTSKQENQE